MPRPTVITIWIEIYEVNTMYQTNCKPSQLDGEQNAVNRSPNDSRYHREFENQGPELGGGGTCCFKCTGFSSSPPRSRNTGVNMGESKASVKQCTLLKAMRHATNFALESTYLKLAFISGASETHPSLKFILNRARSQSQYESQ